MADTTWDFEEFPYFNFSDPGDRLVGTLQEVTADQDQVIRVATEHGDFLHRVKHVAVKRAFAELRPQPGDLIEISFTEKIAIGDQAWFVFDVGVNGSHVQHGNDWHLYLIERRSESDTHSSTGPSSEMKIGVTGNWQRRRQEHEIKGWTIVDTIGPLGGTTLVALERALLEKIDALGWILPGKREIWSAETGITFANLHSLLTHFGIENPTVSTPSSTEISGADRTRSGEESAEPSRADFTGGYPSDEGSIHVDEVEESIRQAQESFTRSAAHLAKSNDKSTETAPADLRGASLAGKDLTNENLAKANLSGANLKKADLKWANLEGANLEGANLEGANLRDADLTRASLRGLDLKGAELKGAELKGADLSGTSLENQNLASAKLYRADLTNAQLAEADLAHADLEHAVLSHADLAGASLEVAALAEAVLDRADLEGANLQSADLSGADLGGANLTNADLHAAHLTEASLYKANLTGADLQGADLTNACLEGANLHGADLQDAVLTGALNKADLSGADLCGQDLTEVDLEFRNLASADLSAANLRNAKLFNADLTNANLCEADLTNADLSAADLTEAGLMLADLTGANLQGANLTRADLSGAIVDLKSRHAFGAKFYNTIMPNGRIRTD